MFCIRFLFIILRFCYLFFPPSYILCKQLYRLLFILLLSDIIIIKRIRILEYYRRKTMTSNRDDFSEKTKNNAAKRVGYRCSFKNCNRPTVGASQENKNKASSIGVAAHICAASPEGPRYDANMTPEERKDISNCIWMCQTHAHLIDTDEKKYTVDLLKKWKREAEQSASDALADPNFFNNYYQKNSNNFDSLSQIFNDMIAEGNYNQLNFLLCQYNMGQLSDKYDEFVLRFKIIYDAYCNRNSLKNDTSQYLSLSCKDGIDELMELFIMLLLEEELKLLFDYCKNSDLKQFATIILDGRAETDLLYSCINQPEPNIPEKYKLLIFKTATNDMALNLKINIQVEGQQQNEKEGLYNKDFYFQVITSIYSLVKRAINNISINLKNDSDFLFIINHLEKINYLDLKIQEIIWENLLNISSIDKDLFQKYYSLCPDILKEYDSIKKTQIVYLSHHEPQKMNINKIMQLAEQTKDYSLITLWLNSIDKNEAKNFINNHRYLLSKSSEILFYRIIIINQLSENETQDLLNEYSSTYKEDFLYHCLKVKFCNDNIDNELSWLQNNLSKLSLYNVNLYLSVLKTNQQWEQLNKISKLPLPTHILCKIADILANSQIQSNMLRSKEIFETAINDGYNIMGLKHNLGIINRNLGYIQAAKTCFQKEYDEYHNIATLKLLICTRYESGDYVDDQYLIDLSNDIDYSSQSLVGATYSKLKKYQNAYKFFIRSLLLNDKQNESLTELCFINQLSPESNDCTSIQENTICILSNDQNSIQIAIHSVAVLDGITPNQFANCQHYSIEDTNISTLLYRKRGETVYYNNIKYQVSNIDSSFEFFSRYAFSEMIKRPDITKIYATSSENILKQISNILKDAKEETDKIIDNYNQSELRIPFSSLSKQVGKNMLVTCEFLMYKNTEKIRNNLNNIILSNKPIFILSYDSIIFLSHLNINLTILNEHNIVCSNTVKNHLINDINDEISAISSKNSFGNMSYSDKKIHLTEYTPELKRERHSYLNNLKSLIKQIKTINDSFDYVPQNEPQKNLFSKLILDNKLLCESSCLGLAQNLPNSIFVTDDQLIYNIASIEKIPNIGLVSLLTYISSKWSTLLEISKSLQQINFFNYLPLFLYKKIFDCMINDTEHSLEDYQKIIHWLSSDTNSEPSHIHNIIIITLFRDIFPHNELQYLNPNNILSKLAIKAYKNQNPGFIAKQIHTAKKDLKATNE